MAADRRLWTLVVSVLLMACANQDTRAPSQIALSDSAGIPVVHNDAPVWPQRVGWRVHGSPDLVLGADLANQDQQFIRVSDAARLDDGRIAVADVKAAEVRIYAPDGALLQVLGGKGQGPGEFTRLVRINLRPGDTLVAWETAGRARAVFGPSGELVDARDFHADVRPRFQNAFEPASSGAMFFLLFDRSWTATPEPTRGRQWLARMDSEGESVDTLAEVPSTTTRAIEIPTSSPLGSTRAVTALFSPNTVMAVGGHPERVVIGDGARARLRVYDTDGTELMKIDWPGSGRHASSSDVAEAIETRLSRRPAEERGVREEALRDTPDDLQTPVFSDLFIARTGEIWARHYPLPSDSVAAWTVFESTGRWLGTVTLPTGLDLLDAGDGYVLGMRRGRFDLGNVELYSIER